MQYAAEKSISEGVMHVKAENCRHGHKALQWKLWRYDHISLDFRGLSSEKDSIRSMVSNIA